MEAKLSVKKVTQAMFERCFKFADADKDDPFYMAVTPTANEKKVYAKYLASKLIIFVSRRQVLRNTESSTCSLRSPLTQPSKGFLWR